MAKEIIWWQKTERKKLSYVVRGYALNDWRCYCFTQFPSVSVGFQARLQ
jgi:hypothetical protein